MFPRRRVEGWTVVSGFIYSASFDYGKPSGVSFNEEVFEEAGSATTGAGEWYFDEDTNTIYARTEQSADPDSGQLIVTYPLYVATTDTYWYATPTDSSSETVYYEALIQKDPVIKSTSSDNLFGYFPTQTSSITLANSENQLTRHIHDGSFNVASIMIYHSLGDEITVADTKLVYNGLMSDIQYSDNTVIINTVDRIDLFNKEWRNSNTSFFSTSDFANLNPIFIGKPIRYVYGYVKGFVPVNVDFVDESPGTSDNRDWVVVGNQTGLTEVSRTVPASPSSTTTRTYVNFVEGIQVGDSIFFDRASGTDEYHLVTAINISPAYIEHEALATPMDTGDTVKKGFVSKVEIIQDDITYVCHYNRDYTVNLAMSAGCSGFSFTTTMEANTGLPSTLSPSDRVLCTVYGRVNDLTLGGPTFGDNDPFTNNLSNPAMVIYDIIKNKSGIAESGINTALFTSVQNDTQLEGIGFAIPKTAQGSFPTYKQIITDILQTGLLRLYFDQDQTWAISLLAPLTSSVDTIDNAEIMGEFGYSYSYGDVISDILVEYLMQEMSNIPARSSGDKSLVTAESATAKYLHKVDKQKTFESLHFRETDAQELADRLSFVFGDRRGVIKINGRSQFFDLELNDTITVSREKLPGFEFVSGTERSVEGAVIDISKSLNSVNIEIDDQLGIENNSGSW